MSLALLLILAVLVVGAGAVLYINTPDKLVFWLSVYGNILSTVVFGALIGLIVFYYQTGLQDDTGKAQARQAAENSRGRLLSLAQAEIEGDIKSMQARRSAATMSAGFPIMYENDITDDFWKAVTATGETKLIDNLDALASITAGYQHIAKVNYWERTFYQSLSGAGRSLTFNSEEKTFTLAEQVYGWYFASLAPAQVAAESALATIKKIRQKD